MDDISATAARAARFAEKYRSLEPALDDMLRHIVEAVERSLRSLRSGCSARSHRKSISDLCSTRLRQRRGLDASIDDIISSFPDLLRIGLVTTSTDDIAILETVCSASFTVISRISRAGSRSIDGFGRRSIRMIVEIPASIRDRFPALPVRVFELRLRTRLQEAWEEAESEITGGQSLPLKSRSIQRKLDALRSQINIADHLLREIRELAKASLPFFERHRELFYESLIPAEFSDEVSPPTEEDHSEAPSAEWMFGENHEDRIDAAISNAVASHARGDFAAAVAWYGVLLGMETDASQCGSLLIRRGMAFTGIGDYQSALDDFEDSHRHDPTNTAASICSAAIHFVTDDIASARVLIDAIKRQEGETEEILFLNTLIALREGNPDQARVECQRAVERSPDFRPAVSLESVLESLQGAPVQPR